MCVLPVCYRHHRPQLRPELRSGARRKPPSAPRHPAAPPGTRPSTTTRATMLKRSRDGDGRSQARNASRVGCRRGTSSGGCAGGPWWGSRGGRSACTRKKPRGAWCGETGWEKLRRRSQLLDSVVMSRLPTQRDIATLSNSCPGLGNFSQTPSRRMRRVGSGRDHLRNPGRLSAMRHRA